MKFKNCLFGATDILKNSDKEKCVYSPYGIIFNSAGLTYGINLSFASPDKIFSINFTKTNTKFCLSLLLIIVICLLVEKNLWI